MQRKGRIIFLAITAAAIAGAGWLTFAPSDSESSFDSKQAAASTTPAPAALPSVLPGGIALPEGLPIDPSGVIGLIGELVD